MGNVDQLCDALAAQNQILRLALHARDGGCHSEECPTQRPRPRACNCGHVEAEAALSLPLHAAVTAMQRRLSETEIERLRDVLVGIEMLTATGDGLPPRETLEIHLLAAEGRAHDPVAWRADPAVIERLRAVIREFR